MSELRRDLGLLPAIAINVGNMIGTGIFLKARVMTCNVGSPTLELAAWVMAGLLSLAGALAYSELASLVPEAGGEYAYVRRAFGRVPAFFCGWTLFTLYKCSSQAALAVGFSLFLNGATQGALLRPILSLDVLGWHGSLTLLSVTAVSSIWIIALINTRSVVRSGDTAFGLTAIKVMFLLGLALTVFGLSGGHVANYAALNEGGDCTGVSASARGGFAGFGAAVLGALWAFDGWSNVAPMVGELKDPMRNAPRAFLGGLGVVAFVYLLVTASYLYALTPTQIASVAPTSTVATEVLRGFLGPAAVAMLALAMAVSAFGSQQASALAGARIGYAMAADGGLPRSLAALSAHTASPTRAIWAQASLASVLALSGSFDALTDGAMVGVWFFVGLSVVAIYVIRAREPDTRGIFRCPGYPLMPAVFLLVVAAVLLTTLMANPSTALVSGLLIAAGLPVYQWMQR